MIFITQAAGAEAAAEGLYAEGSILLSARLHGKVRTLPGKLLQTVHLHETSSIGTGSTPAG